MSPAKTGAQPPPTTMTLMDQKKAQALLDNIQEDRSQMLRLQTQGRRPGVASGKDW
jgi:hypothetical protein